MKLVCSKPQLIDVINTVQRAIAPKTALPILECIKIDANGDGNVVFTGNNIDICIEYNTKCTVTEGGTIAIASKMFGEIVRRLPEGDVTISVNPSNFITKIKSGSSEFNIQGIAPDEFPDAPILDEKFRFTLNEGSLKKLIRKTISFVAQNEGKKPVLTGALFEIKDNSLIEDSFVGAFSSVGPMAHLRPGSHLAGENKIGNFVELKKATMGKGSKASHLTYLGDSELGENVNIGCGTITCNYDGFNKYKTIIGNNVFVGSDTQFVAPVTVGDNVLIAAGSTITKDINTNDLAIARTQQLNIENKGKEIMEINKAKKNSKGK